MPNLKDATDKPLIFVFILLLGAISFTVSLAWNDAIGAIIKKHTPINTNDPTKLKIYYAITATVILIVLAFMLAKMFPTILQKM